MERTLFMHVNINIGLAFQDDTITWKTIASERRDFSFVKARSHLSKTFPLAVVGYLLQGNQKRYF